METNNSSPEYKNGFTVNQCIDHNTYKKKWIPKGRTGPSDRKHGKQREHSPEIGWNKRKSPLNTKQDEGKDTLKEELIQPTQQCHFQPIPIHSDTSSTYPSNYATSNYYAVGSSQSNYMMPQYNMHNSMDQWVAPVSSSMPMDIASTSTGMNPYPYVAPTDPSMNGMIATLPGYLPMPMMNSSLPDVSRKVTKAFPICTLVPPPPGTPAPSRRNRPNGCKTVFVGGLPEKITDEIIKEAFSVCGEISSVRMGKKNFCHIRFTSELHVDQAMLFSGHRIKIENENELTYSRRLHVDFAVARDDKYEYENLMRTLSREARHANFDYRPPSPAPIANFSEAAAATVVENVRNEETFKEACNVLTTWLDRGECNKKNAGTFYSMILSIYNHVGALVSKKTMIESELAAVKQKLHQQSTFNEAQFTDVERVFKSALIQKVWDHFTKAQRKNIEQWKKQTTKTKMQNLENLLEERIEEEMEMSDEEDPDASEDSKKSPEPREELSRLHEDQVRLLEENELLRTRLRTAHEESEKKITALTDTYQLMQQNYLEAKNKLEEALKEKVALESIPLDKTQMCGGNYQSVSGAVSVTERDAHLVSLIANFLNVHPSGASIDYICSYLVKMDRNINTRYVENLMKKCNTVFKEESTGIGAAAEKKWMFWGYKFYTSAISE